MTGAEEATRAAARAAWGASGLELEAGEDGGRGAEEEEGTRRTRRAEVGRSASVPNAVYRCVAFDIFFKLRFCAWLVAFLFY